MSGGDDRPRRSRHLSGEERALWRTVTRAIAPLRRRAAKTAPDSSEPPPVARPTRTRAAAAPAPAKPLKPATPPLAPLERTLRRKLSRGSAAIDRRIDLHGLKQDEAYDALAGFLAAAQGDGAKVVLVITGKGARASDDPFSSRGVLRRLVPQWLGQSAFRSLVVGFDEAAHGHGGEGALYVRLRRPRGRTSEVRE